MLQLLRYIMKLEVAELTQGFSLDFKVRSLDAIENDYH